jgi:hypothetical protein
MVANAGVLLVKSFVESLFYILLLADHIGANVAPYKARPRPDHWCQPSRHLPLQMISQGRGGRIIGRVARSTVSCVFGLEGGSARNLGKACSSSRVA